MAERGWDSWFAQNVPWAQTVTQPIESPQTHCIYLLSHRHTHKDIVFFSDFCCPQLKNKHSQHLLMCGHGESRDFSWINLYGKGDLNIKVVNEFSQVEALCPKWWGRERAWLIWIAAIAQCQGMEERRPLVAGIINRQINFWSPLERLQPARCGEISYLVTPASHKSQQGQNMCKNYLFSSFQKRCWKKKKKKRHWKDCTYTWYLTKTPNVRAADYNLSNFEVLRGLPPTLILCLWLPSIKVFCSASLLQSFDN